MNILRRLLGAKDKNEFNPVIVFDTDTIYFGEHGKLVVTHHKKRIIDRSIPFAFVGMTKAPALNEYHFHLIFEAAREQGYIPHEIVEYGRNAEIVTIDSDEPNVNSAAAAIARVSGKSPAKASSGSVILT